MRSLHLASDGKHLETLVAFVEQTLKTPGLKVSTNERVFNEEGVQIAEFDVEVSGKFGSTEIRWLIECRDRPGEGPAPGSWIEQLVGRRTRFGFNKVTAVSTTGFAVGAIEFAKAQEIELREVASLSPEAFLPWCSMRTVLEIDQIANLGHANIIVDDCEPDKKQAFESLLTAATLNAPILRSMKTGERSSLVNAFLGAVNSRGNLFDNVVEDGQGKSVQLKVEYANDDDHFVIDTDSGPLRVRFIVFTGLLEAKTSVAPLVGITEYRKLESKDAISEVVSFAPQKFLGGQASFQLHRITETGEIYFGLTKIPDSD